MDIPGPLPLRNISVPPAVTAVAGCNCGGTTFHRVQSYWEPPGTGCTIWDLPPDEMMTAVDATEDRLRAFTDGLNARLRALAGLG